MISTQLVRLGAEPITRIVHNLLNRSVVRFAVRPGLLLAGAFGGLILIGTVVLMLPAATHEPGRLGWIDALFTATSAVCVTGLIVVDTGSCFTPFGQTVILVLFQLGGLGIVVFAAGATHVMGLRLSFRSKAALYDVLYQSSAATSLRADLLRVVLLTFAAEAVGAALLYPVFKENPGGHSPAFSAAFHAVSAFCNAGFGLYSDSLTAYRHRPILMMTIMALIVLGGIGHHVVLEGLRRLTDRIRRRRSRTVHWSLSSRVAIGVSAVLIVLGAIALCLLDSEDLGDDWMNRTGNAIFQSITARTAGFNTIDISVLPTASLLFLIGLMFIGGSPGSCAGGIKTTTFAAWTARLWGRVRGRQDTVMRGRRLPQDVSSKVSIVFGLAITWIVLGSFILAITERNTSGAGLEDLLFEQVSAFGTVGLSTGITAALSNVGKLWIVASMFVGRLGPLTVALVILSPRTEDIRYPEEKLMIG